MTLFVGVNMIKTAFTKWCPLINFLRKQGLTD
ncbi:YgaP-like transmembrane domain [Pseudoalteromonas ostreae]